MRRVRGSRPEDPRDGTASSPSPADEDLSTSAKADRHPAVAVLADYGVVSARVLRSPPRAATCYRRAGISLPLEPNGGSCSTTGRPTGRRPSRSSGVVGSLVVAGLFVLANRVFPAKRPNRQATDGGEMRRRAERRELHSLDEQFAETDFVEGRHVAFYLPKRAWPSRSTPRRSSASNASPSTPSCANTRCPASTSAPPALRDARSRPGPDPEEEPHPTVQAFSARPDPTRRGRRESGLPRAGQGGPPGPRRRRGRVQARPGSVHHCKTARVWYSRQPHRRERLNTCHCIGTQQTGTAAFLLICILSLYMELGPTICDPMALQVELLLAVAENRACSRRVEIRDYLSSSTRGSSRPPVRSSAHRESRRPSTPPNRLVSTE